MANEYGAGWISEYALGHTKPLRVITKGINTPAFCAIDASGSGVLKFPPGSLTPSNGEISLYFSSGVAYYPPLLP